MAEEKNIMTGGGELDANCDRFKNLKHSTVCPFAFTEQGVAMLASVLRSETAIRVSIHNGCFCVHAPFLDKQCRCVQKIVNYRISSA